MPIQQMLLGTGGGINYAVGQVVFDGDNVSQSWTVPADVYSISVVCVGRGESNLDTTTGDGGALAWASNIPVTPGATLTYTTRAAHDKNNPPSGDSILSGPASGSQAAWSVTGTSSSSGTQSSTYFTGTPGASRQGNRGGNGIVANTGVGWFNVTHMGGGVAQQVIAVRGPTLPQVVLTAITLLAVVLAMATVALLAIHSEVLVDQVVAAVLAY